MGTTRDECRCVIYSSMHLISRGYCCRGVGIDLRLKYLMVTIIMLRMDSNWPLAMSKASGSSSGSNVITSCAQRFASSSSGERLPE